MSTEVKSFHIGDIISITSGKLVSLDHIGGVYKILGWMVSGDLMTHSLPRVSDECEPALRAAFPDLVKLEVPPIGSLADAKAWFARLAEDGVSMRRDVPKISDSEHARIDPILEAQYLVGADKVHVMEVDR